MKRAPACQPFPASRNAPRTARQRSARATKHISTSLRFPPPCALFLQVSTEHILLGLVAEDAGKGGFMATGLTVRASRQGGCLVAGLWGAPHAPGHGPVPAACRAALPRDTCFTAHALPLISLACPAHHAD